MSTASINRQHAKNLTTSRKLKETLTGFYHAGLLEAWHRKAIFIYWVALIYCAADRDLIRGLWKRPNTFSPIPLEPVKSISTALGWLLKNAEKFASAHTEQIEQGWADRAAELEEIERERLSREPVEEESPVDGTESMEDQEAPETTNEESTEQNPVRPSLSTMEIDPEGNTELNLSIGSEGEDAEEAPVEDEEAGIQEQQDTDPEDSPQDIQSMLHEVNSK
jgi:hypothetical protein